MFFKTHKSFQKFISLNGLVFFNQNKIFIVKQLKDISFSKYIRKEMTTKHDYIFDLMSEIQSEMEEDFLMLGIKRIKHS
jgi:hypothetical protein